MLENLAPSDRKYSDDPAEQAFCAYQERRILRLGSALVGLLTGGRIRRLDDLQDFVWEQALDFVAPMEPDVRDVLIRDVPDLPWEGRNGPRLYWRLMYAAHVELLADKARTSGDARSWRKPILPVVATTSALVGKLTRGEPADGFLSAIFRPGATPLGNALYAGIIDRAGDQIRIRTQLPRKPVPLAPFTIVRCGDVAAEVTGYGFDGRVAVSRESEPGDRAGLDWSLDVATGRWTALAHPERLLPRR